MKKTKRKIFETSMKLFSEKGYEATSIEEITATVGVAKGTLYYHFSSKEEIFNFLIEEGMKLLKISIEIKTSKCETTIDKLKAIVLIQLKGIKKYENVLTIVMSQVWGNEPRNVLCKEKVMEYIKVIQNILEERNPKWRHQKLRCRSVGMRTFFADLLDFNLPQKSGRF